MADSPIQLRPYRASDFETLYRMDQVCFPKGIAYGRFELKVYLRTRVSYCLIAEALDKIAGFILAELPADEGHIITLDVLGDYRRQGIGSLLLAAAEKELSLRGGKRMVLETASSNTAAIALWGKHGYRQTVTIKDYYGAGLDALKMGKNINAALDVGIR